ncbi:adenylyl-sulfate kinase [Nocardioides dongkuii]|uniref:adenylyl-sulfate kinase n=1 Tax=Nocardioides dongkuii TaxID=2760089 RepID=UPI0018788A27|nr:adenylyl-sulfate kinase [Nocardioides dongkuii]
MPEPVPQHCPTPRELDDLELLVTGAAHPTTRFGEPGSPLTLTLPPAVESAAREEGAVELVDPEGLPLARVTVPSGEVESLAHAEFGPFRHLYLTPSTVHRRYRGRTFVPVAHALTEGQVEQLRAAGPLVLLALVGTGTAELSPVALLRATLRAAELIGDAEVVAVPLAAHGDADADHALGVQVVSTYAGNDPVIGLVDPSDDDAYPPAIAEVVDFDQPPVDRQGLVVFFTGLSGSGKSTLARALMDRLLEQGGRTVTSLDGDVVRRNLSAGLTFSKADRETNIRRIGWVAAEISRHGGVAVCSPIAPFDETRQQVRAMVDDAGGAFFLVHVATPLEECERRDRKGLYAKARRGEIPEFTGISSPYEVPEDADVTVDTTGRSIEDALDDVLVALREAGYLDLTSAPASTPLAEQGGTVGPNRETPAPVVEQGGAPAPTVVETPETEKQRQPGPTAGSPGFDTLRTSSFAAQPPAEDAPLKVLFVCTANICRSPFMELMARQLAGPDANIEFRSAGTHGFADHEMDEVMATTLAPRGVADHSAFLSRAIDKAILDEADLVLTAEAAHRTFILDDHPSLFRKVFTIGQFAEVVRALGPDVSGRELLEQAAQRRGNADAALDVHDPYRRGPEAAETAAAGIEELLRVVVPALAGTRETTA